MKQFIGILLFVIILSGFSSCTNPTISKPAKLISKDKFITMMVDIYLVQGIDNGFNIQDSAVTISQTDLYYSVLKKYKVADTVFIRSLIYYSSFPKEYEKMHLEIMNNLKESELQFKPKEKLNGEPK